MERKKRVRRGLPPIPPDHPVGPWTCQRPGCDGSGVGYIGKKYCNDTCRSAAWRAKQTEGGRVRTRKGWRDKVPA